MDWALRKIKANQIERQLMSVPSLRRPRIGWIKTLREILGMSSRQLGERCNISSERILKIETDEIDNKVTMATLEKVANAMNCNFVYAFVPKEGLIQMVEKEAENKAKIRLKRVSHMMALEDQKVSEEVLNEQTEIFKEELLKGKITKLWEK